MEQKKTIIFYDPDSTGQVRSFSFSTKQLKLFLIALALLTSLSLVSLTFLISFAFERSTFLQWRSENRRLKSQIKLYDPLINSLETKVATLDLTKDRLLDVETISTTDLNNNPDEVKLENSIFDELKGSIYKRGALTPVFSHLDTAIDTRIDGILNLAMALEEKEFLLQSTPTGSPVSGKLSSRFDFRYSPFNGRLVFHEGIDIAAPMGAPIHASAKGLVVFAGYKSGYGFLVTLDHGYGFVTRYAHNSRLLVREGDYVQRGEKIALVGSTGHSTGPHLHYEVLINGIPVNPLNFMFKNEELSDFELKENITSVKSDFK